MIVSVLSAFSLFMSIVLFKNYMFLGQARRALWFWTLPVAEGERLFNKFLREEAEKEKPPIS